MVPNEVGGVGAALTNMLIMLTVGICQLLMGYIMNLFGSQSEAYHFALMIIPLCLIASILLSYYLHKFKSVVGLVA
jgi:K+-transporting ATPase A subunit